FDAHLAQLLNLAVEGARVDDHPVADDAGGFLVQDAGRNESQDELALSDANSVAGVMTALVARDDIEMRRQNVDDLAFSFVAPLSAHYHKIFHVSLKQALEAGLAVPMAFANSGSPPPKQTNRRTLPAAIDAPVQLKMLMTAP